MSQKLFAISKIGCPFCETLEDGHASCGLPMRINRYKYQHGLFGKGFLLFAIVLYEKVYTTKTDIDTDYVDSLMGVPKGFQKEKV